MNMIEKVARAMCLNRKFIWENCDKAYWRGAAKAAIEAMYEPTDEMKNAAGRGSIFPPYTFNHIEAWTVMIDEALKDG